MTDLHFYTTMDSPVGEIVLTSDGKSLALAFIRCLIPIMQKLKQVCMILKPFNEAIEQFAGIFCR